jgi:hypothetical protein
VLITSMGRRAVPRAMAGQLLAAAVVMAAFAAYQIHEVGQVRYYFYKLELAGYVACLAGLGLLGVILHRIPLPGRLSRPAGPLGRRLREIPLAVIAGSAALLVMVAVQPRSPAAGSLPIWGGTPLAFWNAGQFTEKTGGEYGGVRVPQAKRLEPTFAALAGARILGDGMPTLVVSGGRQDDRYDTFLAAVLNRNMGQMTPAIAAYLSIPGHPRSELAAVRQGLIQTPVPVRLVAASQALARQLRRMLAENPGLKVTRIIVVPELLGQAGDLRE